MAPKRSVFLYQVFIFVKSFEYFDELKNQSFVTEPLIDQNF